MRGTTQPDAVAVDRSKAEAIALACLQAAPFVEDKPWSFSWFDSPFSLFSEGLARVRHEEEELRSHASHCLLCPEDLNRTIYLDPYLTAGDWTTEGNASTETQLIALRQLSADRRCDFWQSKLPWDAGGCEYTAFRPLTREMPVSHYGFPHGFGNTWLANAQRDHDSSPQTTAARLRKWVKAYQAMAASVGWWVIFGNSVLLVPKPDSMSYDLEGRLHGIDGPAVVYPDGWGLYAFHGHALPHWSDDPGASTLRRILAVRDPKLRSSMLELLDDDSAEEAGVADLILHETNAEVRQKLLARFGLDQVANALGARRLAKDRFGELWMVPAQIGIGPMKFVKVVDATPRTNGTPVYWLPVPIEMTSAREAVAWSFGLPRYEYRPEVET